MPLHAQYGQGTKKKRIGSAAMNDESQMFQWIVYLLPGFAKVNVLSRG